MGNFYRCFSEPESTTDIDNDTTPAAGYIYRGSDLYVDPDGEEIDRWNSVTLFCPAHLPAGGDPDWEIIPNFNLDDYLAEQAALEEEEE